jgi:SAM-dependent methyltransferase
VNSAIEVNMTNYTITPEQTKWAEYKQALAEEMQSGGEVTLRSLSSNPIYHPKLNAYRGRILGGIEHATDPVEWTDFLLTEYGPKQRCLSLGSGLGRVEKHLVEIGFATSIDAIDVCTDVNAGERLKDENIVTKQGDLNFVELEECTYDFILCHGILHHLINLEHVLEQINLALRPDGLFLVYEYVGENRWQFSAERMRQLRQLFPDVSLTLYPRWKVDGFESVRSGELLPLLQSFFGNRAERTVSFGGVYFPALRCSTVRSETYVSRIIHEDESALKSGAFLPCYHMGLYRKTSQPPPIARAWTDDELKERLERRLPVSALAWDRFKQTRIGTKLRDWKRGLLERESSTAGGNGT